jgi:hypothetical protein
VNRHVLSPLLADRVRPPLPLSDLPNFPVAQLPIDLPPWVRPSRSRLSKRFVCSFVALYLVSSAFAGPGHGRNCTPLLPLPLFSPRLPDRRVLSHLVLQLLPRCVRLVGCPRLYHHPAKLGRHSSCPSLPWSRHLFFFASSRRACARMGKTLHFCAVNFLLTCRSLCATTVFRKGWG